MGSRRRRRTRRIRPIRSNASAQSRTECTWWTCLPRAHRRGRASCSDSRAAYPRAAVLAQLRVLLDEGRDVSVHLVVHGPDDPYLTETVDEIRTVLDDRCPIHVSVIAPVGRGRDLANAGLLRASGTADPCELASW